MTKPIRSSAVFEVLLKVVGSLVCKEQWNRLRSTCRQLRSILVLMSNNRQDCVVSISCNCLLIDEDSDTANRRERYESSAYHPVALHHSRSPAQDFALERISDFQLSTECLQCAKTRCSTVEIAHGLPRAAPICLIISYSKTLHGGHGSLQNRLLHLHTSSGTTDDRVAYTTTHVLARVAACSKTLGQRGARAGKTTAAPPGL